MIYLNGWLNGGYFDNKNKKNKQQQTGQYPYKSSNGYASEPERGHNSDYIKYKTLDRRRIPSSEKYVDWFFFLFSFLLLLFDSSTLLF